MFQKIRKLLTTIALCLTLPLTGQAGSPAITAASTKKIMLEMFRDHATFEKLSPELTRRILDAFLYEMDPHKTYLIKAAIKPYLTPSEDQLIKISHRIENKDFRDFYTLLGTMQTSIEKMRALVKETSTPQKKPFKGKIDLKTLHWGDNYQELKTRRDHIRSCQIKSAELFDIDTKERMEQKLDKQIRSSEAKLLTSSKEDLENKAHELFLKAFAQSLDDHSNYFTAWEAEQYAMQVKQHLHGIGAQLRDDIEGLTIVHILENSPTQAHGNIKTGDKIIAVDGETVIGMDIEDAVQMIRGPKGTSVHLTLLREDGEGEPQKIEADIVRDRIQLKETSFQKELVPFGDGELAYFRLYSFYQDSDSSSESDIQNALNSALRSKRPLKGVLLDLRSNGGGLLEQAVKVAGLFLKKGIIASIKDSQNHIEHRRSFRAHPVWEGPLLVLIDRASASAAEIVAGALQDYGRAIIVGDKRSFGKGSYQVFTFNPMRSEKASPLGEYKVTRGLYYTASGRSPQLSGIASDIEVPSGLKESDIGESLAKHPIENRTIKPGFDDTLEDVHPFYRAAIRRQYEHNRQEKLDLYSPFLTTLKSNSKKRIERNPDFQTFLQITQKEHLTKKDLQSYGLNDLAKEEGLDILKDLVLLEMQAQKAA